MGSNGRQGTQSGGEYGWKRMEEDEMEWRRVKDKKEWDDGFVVVVFGIGYGIVGMRPG